MADRSEPGFDGTAHRPGDPGYDRARMPWNLAFAAQPELVVEARSAADVVAAVRLARGRGLPVAVQATGHGTTVRPDGAVLVSTRLLDDVAIATDSATATVGAGAPWSGVLEAAHRHGLAPLLGSSPLVGAVGFSLGGGLGWLSRRHGLAVDHVRALTVVLADGSVVHASEDERPDLFWALRGAGAGSLGVVVEMEIGLVPVTTVYAGNLLYPIESAPRVFEEYNRWSEDHPRDMTSAFTLMNYPPFDTVPEVLRGRSFAIVRGAHCGDVGDGADLVDQFRALATPEVDLFGPMPFTEIAAVSQDPVDPLPARSSARWLSGIDSDVLEAMIDVTAPTGGAPLVILAETRHAGGAIADPVPGASFAPRTAPRLLQVVSAVPDGPAEAEVDARLTDLWERLDGVTLPGAYLNMVEGEERVDLARATFGEEAWSRLAAVKREVDPDDLFRLGLDLTA